MSTDSETRRVPARSCKQLEAQQARPGQDQAAAARQDPHPPALPAVRPAAGRLPQVRHLPHLLPQHGQRRADPRRQEGELVRRSDDAMMTDPIADMLTRIRNANRIEPPAVDMPATQAEGSASPRCSRTRASSSTTRSARCVTDEQGRHACSSTPADAERSEAGPARLPEVRPRRRTRHPPHRARQQAGPPAVPRLQGTEAGARRPGHLRSSAPAAA